MRSAGGQKGSKSTPARRLWVAVAAAGLCALVFHVRSLYASLSADDLVLIERVVGVVPPQTTLWRYVSGPSYFTAAYLLFGANPVPYHVVNWLLHAVNAMLVVVLARRLGANLTVAAAAGILFGTQRIVLPVLHQAAGICDLLAVFFTLIALLAGRLIPALGAWVLALMSKEQVLFAPAALLGDHASPELRGRARRLAPIALVWLSYLVVLHFAGGGPGGAAYAQTVGRGTFENLMIYATWTFGFAGVLPRDMLYRGAGAWWPGLVPLVVLAFVAWRARREAPLVLTGLIWWLLALVPVLGLRSQVYPYYLYPTLVGMAIAVPAALWTVGVWIGGLIAPERTGGRARVAGPRIATTLIAVVLVVSTGAGWLLQQMRLNDVRRNDWLLGKSLYVERILGSYAASFPRGTHRVVVVSPPGTGEVISTVTGAVMDSIPASVPSYRMLEAVLDHGRALRALYGDLEDVAFIDHWDPTYADYDVAVEVNEGWLMRCGRGVDGQLTLAQLLLQTGNYDSARRYLPDVIAAWPRDPRLRTVYATALERTGDAEGARAQTAIAEQLEAGAAGSPPSVDSPAARH